MHNDFGRGYLVVDTGYTWLVNANLPVRRNSHIDAVIAK